MSDRRRSKVELQLDMFAALDKPFVRYEAIWTQLDMWIKNLKMIRAQLRFSELPDNLKYSLETGLTLLGHKIADYQYQIGFHTLSHRHDNMADKMKDPDILSMDHTPEADILAEYLTRSLSRLRGLVLANKDLIGDNLKSSLDLHKKLLIIDNG